MQRAPKQWCLTKAETINTFENWKQNLVYTLSLDSNFAPFLLDAVTWAKKTKANPLRGFVNDVEGVENKRTAQQKVNYLELMLGQIANFCPIISRNTIVKNSVSLASIWQTIRLHFGFQTTGGHLLDFADIRLENDEKPEDLYQRLMAFVEDNLLKTTGLTHHESQLDEDEELSPTLENIVVLTWLKLIHPELPKLVKQRYGTELRSRTLSSIKPEISQSIASLIDEIHTTESAKVMRAAPFQHYNKAPRSSQPRNGHPSKKSCPLCKQGGRPDGHFLSECRLLPESDRKYMVRARQIIGLLETDSSDAAVFDPEYNTAPNVNSDSCSAAQRIQVRQSPYVDAFYNDQAARITIDSGATGNMISLAAAKRFKADIRKSSQSAHQADGASPLKVV